MNSLIIQLLIYGLLFLIITWFQKVDDRKNNKQRKTLYDMYKFPVLIISIIILIVNIDIKRCTNLIFIQPLETVDMKCNEPTIINDNNLGKPFFNFGKDVPISDQQIFTDIADF
jgi:hypothetical protein